MARRRVRGRGSIEVLKTKGGRVKGYRARVRGTQPDGRPYDLAKVCKAREDAERALAALLKRALDVEAGLVVLEETLTLAEWRAKATRRGLTWRRVDSSIWKHLRPLWNLPLVALDAGRVRAWAEKMGKSYAAGTVRSAWILLSRVVNSALAHRVIARRPWGEAPLRLVSDSSCGQRDALEPHEWQAVRDAARRIDAAGGGGALSDLWLRLSTMLVTGARPVELCQLTPADIVPGEHGPMMSVGPGIIAKGSKPGLRPLGVELAEALRVHLESMPDGARRTGLLFPMKGTRGKWRPRWRMDQRGDKAGRYWLGSTETGALRSESGVGHFVPYELRHTRLTEVAYRSGSQLAQDVGGHRHPKTTQRYVHGAKRHMTPELFDVADLIGAADPSKGPDDTGGGAPVKRGRFAVHEGGSAPTPVDPSGSRAHTRLSAGGREEGAGPDEWAEVAGYLEAVRAHGCDAVARHVVRTVGPAEARWVAGELAKARLAPRCTDEEGAALVGLVHRLRAHSGAALAATVGGEGLQNIEKWYDSGLLG